MILFGAIDNFVLLACMTAGVGLDRVWLPRRWRTPAMSAVVAGLVGNAASDGLAAIPMGCGAVAGVVAGCLLVLFALPLVARWIVAGESRRLSSGACASEG